MHNYTPLLYCITVLIFSLESVHPTSYTFAASRRAQLFSLTAKSPCIISLSHCIKVAAAAPSSAGCIASSSPQAASFPFLSVNWTKKLDIFCFGPLSNRHKPSHWICQKSSAHNLRENGHEALSTTSALERDTFYLSPHHLS